MDRGAWARLRGLVVPILLIAGWEIGSRLGILPADTMSRPSLALVAGWAALKDGSLLQATAETFQSALGGLALGSAIGVALGLPIGLVADLGGGRRTDARRAAAGAVPGAAAARAADLRLRRAHGDHGRRLRLHLAGADRHGRRGARHRAAAHRGLAHARDAAPRQHGADRAAGDAGADRRRHPRRRRHRARRRRHGRDRAQPARPRLRHDRRVAIAAARPHVGGAACGSA